MRKLQRSLKSELLEPRYVLDGALYAAVDDLYSVHQNDPVVTLDVLVNDLKVPSYEGDGLITSLSFGSEGGAITRTSDGRAIRYAPPADFFGVETFTYVVDHQFSAQVQVQVNAPLAMDQFEIAPDGLEHNLDVLFNDPFWDGYAGPRRITSVSVTSAGGTLAVDSDGLSLRYRAPDGAFGKDEFVYIVDALYPARVTINVPQTLAADRFEMVQNHSTTLNLLANDPFWGGYPGARRITHLLAGNSTAEIVVSGDGRSVDYTPSANYSGWDSFRYVVDGEYETDVSVVVHRPVQDDWFQTDENSTNQSFNVTNNDRYRDLDQRWHDVVTRVTSVGPAESGGETSISADGQSVLYSPPAGFVGTDVFTYTADGLHEARVSVQVNRPVRDDYLSQGVFQDTPDAALDVMANDFLGNGYTGPRLITSVGVATNGGQVRIAPGSKSLFYTPAPGYVGSDQFTYTVDGILEATAAVYVAPLAQSDGYNFCADPTHGPYQLNVLTNDYFASGYQGPGVITSITDPSGGGVAQIVGGSVIRYSPSSVGAESLTYTVDGQYTGQVWISINGQLRGDRAVVDANSRGRSIDVLTNDFVHYAYSQCPAGSYAGAKWITAVSDSEQGGVVTIAPDGRSVDYQPPADYHGSDAFSYTVDGIMQATVQVEVIRRVRDDRFRVAGNASSERLPVLVNDLFGADYAGGQQITGVSASSREGSTEGTVQISADRRSVLYTPAPGFTGVDAFVYTVDGTLKAEVEVVVGSSREDQFPTFGSVEAYQQFLIDDALVRYDGLFGQPTYYGCYECDGLETTAFHGTPTTRDHSETNVQVEGVDEGDIIEFDSDYAYVLTDGALVIVDAWPVEQIATVATVPIDGTAIAEYLHGDRLTVLSTRGGYYYYPDFTAGDLVVGEVTGDRSVGLEDLVGGDLGFRPFPPPVFEPYETIVTILDVSDRSAPVVVQTTSMEGLYVDSRAIGDYVYALVRNDAAVAPLPLVIHDDANPDDANPHVFYPVGTYETREAYLARVSANPGDLIDGALPNYTSYGPDGSAVRTGLLNEPADIYRPVQANASNLISVVSFHVESNEPGLADTSGVYASGAGSVYASLENFYVFDADYSAEDGALTRIVKFDWDGATGGVEFAATTTLPGNILNQFSADELGDKLRVATTLSNNGAGNWTGRAENALFVLQEDEGVFEFVGSLQNLALDETMRSIRYLGDRAFITTFQTIDPLFGIDLSDPENPQSLGHLTLPGFSSYMQLIDASHLLTVGQNTPGGTNGPTQVALFDVSDLAQPIRIDEYTFERFSTSEAQVDHHAFGYFAVHDLLALPTMRTYTVRVDSDGDGYRETRQSVTEHELALLRIDVSQSSSGRAIEWMGEISHDTAVRRSGYIDDVLFSIARDSVKAVRVGDPGTVIAEVAIPLAEATGGGTVSPTRPFPAKWSSDYLADAVVRSLADLAGRLQVERGAVWATTAEPTSQGGIQLVLQAGDARYLYRTASDGSVTLADANYTFPAGADAWHDIAPVVAPTTSDWGANLLAWQRGFDGFASSDRDGDGDADGSDLLDWQRTFDGAKPIGPTAIDDALAVWESDFGAPSAIHAVAQGASAAAVAPTLVDLVDAAMAVEQLRTRPSRRGLW